MKNVDIDETLDTFQELAELFENGDLYSDDLEYSIYGIDKQTLKNIMDQG